MGLALFLSALFAEGRVRVAASDPLPADIEQVDSQLLVFERERRDDLSAAPPDVSLEAARHGAMMLYRACQFLVFRDVEPETIQRELSPDIEYSSASSTHYSIDLVLRYLPDVVRLARGKSEGDPLVTELIRLAGRWPLSGVGIAGAEEGDVAAIAADTCLLRLYVDRIIARHDFRRLVNEQVRDAAVQAIGAFPELAPEAAAAMGMTDRTRDL